MKEQNPGGTYSVSTTFPINFLRCTRQIGHKTGFVEVDCWTYLLVFSRHILIPSLLPFSRRGTETPPNQLRACGGHVTSCHDA